MGINEIYSAMVAAAPSRNRQIERLEKVNEALVRALEYYIATAVQDTKWVEAVAALKLAKEPA